MLYLLTAIYILFPILATPLLILGLLLDKRNIKFYIFYLLINVSLIGYYYIPKTSNDLFRHYIIMDYLKDLSLIEVINNFSTDPLIIKNLWFYLVSVTDNYGLLPFSAIFITYFLIANDIIDFGRKEKVPYKLILLSILCTLLWFPIILPLSGVRFSTAIVLFFHAVFRELVLKKRDFLTICYYIIPLFLHYSIVVLIIIRLLLGVFRKSNLAFVIMLGWIALLPIIIEMLNNLNVPYLTNLLDKIYIYSDIHFRNDTYNNFLYFVKIFINIFIVLLFIIIKKNLNFIYEKYENFYLYSLSLAAFCIGGIGLYSILNRYGQLTIIFLPFLIIPLIKHLKFKLINIFAIIYFPILVIVGIYIQYVPLKFAQYNISIEELLIKNIFQILW